MSPDGSLGGMGYIQKISDMRRQLMNCIEVLSAFTDTLYDELSAPHWHPAEDKLTPRDHEEVKQIVDEAETIKEDPEQWAEEAEEELTEDPIGKTASGDPLVRLAGQVLASAKMAGGQNHPAYQEAMRALIHAQRVLGGAQ